MNKITDTNTEERRFDTSLDTNFYDSECHCGEKEHEEYDNEIPDCWFMDYTLNAVDMDEFSNGVKEYSRICGKMSALISMGVDPIHALAYISECDDRDVTYKNNLEIAKIQSDTQVSVAKCSMASSLS